MSKLPQKLLKRDDYIQDGANPSTGVVLLACTNGDDECRRSRVIVVRPELTLSYGFEGDGVTSIDAAPDGSAWALGENGHVIRFDWRSPTSDTELAASVRRFTIEGVEGTGPLRRLRRIGDDLIAVGSVGQCAHFVGNGFEVLPRLAVDGNEVTIEDLAGTSLTDFTVVSNDGYAARFDGQRWHTIDLPSKAPLNSIARLADGRYAIVGDGATVLFGAADRWESLPLPNDEHDYWGVAREDDTIYLAHVGGIDVVSGGSVAVVKIAKRSRKEFAVMRTGADGVWSFAGHSVGRIVGGQWQWML